jgi:hypothetical protein
MKSEKLLQFIWQHKLFDVTAVTHTVQGDAMQIINTGTLNVNQGPDFINGRIKIADTIWVGEVELHVKASEWILHKHQLDRAYDKVIVHVVYEADKLIDDVHGNSIPCIELKPHINKALLGYYEDLMDAQTFIPCANMMQDLPYFIVQQQLDRAVAERLGQKAELVQELLKLTNNDWSEVLYIMIARAFGGNLNADAMQALAVRLPVRLLTKQKYNLLSVEACMFGVSGLLPEALSNNQYIKSLQQDYDFQAQKLSLLKMDATRWKFLRMRPANFPTIRIAQFAALFCKSNYLWANVIEGASIKEITKSLDLEASDYWQTHFTFDVNKTHGTKSAQMGLTQVHHIIINAIVPSLYAYGLYLGEQKFCEQAIDYLQSLPMEKNNITNLLKDVLPAEKIDAAVGQGYIAQYKNYCQPKRCLQCAVGFAILKPKAS